MALTHDSQPTTTSPAPSIRKSRKSDSILSYTATTTSLTDLYDDGDGSVDPIYRAKANVLNRAIQDIGMGKYQWYLFIVAGFGWFADSVWPLLSGLILTSVVNEFHFSAPFLSLATNVGLLVGAIFWSVGSDVWGRRWSFNLTLLLAGAFGLAAGGSPNFVTLASLLAVSGAGVGGNMPVDSAVFLDLVPASHQYLLTVMSIWWAFGQLLASLVAWPLIANFSCTSPVCLRADNMGWRYLLFTLGGFTLSLWLLRFFTFKLVESPRYLIGMGRDADAVAVIAEVANFNNMETTLTVEQLEKAGKDADPKGIHLPDKKIVLSRTSVFTSEHIKALFRTKKMALSTSLLILLWGVIGLASTLYNSFLPYILTSRGVQYGDGSLYITYRNQVILACIGIPSAFAAGYAVELPFLGRTRTLALSSGKSWLTGAFLFASTTARSSRALLGWNCGYAFNSNIMYGVLYAVSPEIFPAKDRGTGNAMVSTATRVFGIVAPVIALYANLETAVPVYVSGGLIMFAGLLALMLPYEPRGRASI